MVDETLLSRAVAQLTQVLGTEPARWLLVDVTGQQLLLIEGAAVAHTYPISTATVGVDAREGSGGTPPGVHRIERKIGAQLPAGTVFVDREPTGEVCLPTERSGGSDERDLILTRILTLAGLEDGVNRGGDVDSRNRYIYLHGTNHEDRIGHPVSHGCIRLTNRDVVDLFDRIGQDDPVVVV